MVPTSGSDGGGESTLAGDGPPESSSAPGNSGSEPGTAAGRTAAVVVRRPVRTGPDAVADRILEWARGRGRGEPGRLPESVRTLSAFLERPEDRHPGLVWYLEVDAATLDGTWADPAERVRRTVESDVDGLADHLVPTDESRVLADGVDRAATIVHEGIEDRPRAVGTHPDGRPVVLAAGDGDPPDVAAVRVRATTPLGEWFLRGFTRAVGALPEDGRLERAFRRATRSVLEEERTFTESILLERTDGGYFLWWYLEADDLDRVAEAFDASDNPVARASDVAVDLVVADPAALSDPGRASSHEPLVHVVDPERPGFGGG